MSHQLKSHIFSSDINKSLNLAGCKYMRLVSLVYITLLSASTIVAYRIVLIGPFAEPGSTLIYTFSFFWANVFAEVYGPVLSKKLIWEMVVCGYFFALLLFAVNLLPVPAYWNHNEAYDQVIGHIIRFTNAGVIGFLLSAYLNVFLLTKWKHKMHGNLFWLRSLLSSSISEGLATFVAGIITFFGMMPLNSILMIMGNALVFKLLYGLILVWPASIMVYLLKQKEKNYNPSLQALSHSL